MQIFASMLERNGDVTRVVLEVDIKDPVHSVKEKIEAERGIATHDQRLIYGGKQLLDDKTLWHYNIQEGSTLNVYLRLQPTHSKSLVPAESLFPTDDTAQATINQWRRLAKQGRFDADTHIVDPEAHYVALESIERSIVISSELHRQSGAYDLHTEIGAQEVLLRLQETSTPSTVPSWILELMLDIQIEGTVSDTTRAIVQLCESYVIIQSVIDRFDFLVTNKFSAKFFSILVMRDEKDTAELVEITRSALANVVEILLAALTVAREESERGICELVKPALEHLHTIIGCEPVVSNTLGACRAMACLLDLALVCYVGSHGSRFDQEYLGREVRSLGADSGQFGFECSLQNLACLNGFLDSREVWVFTMHCGTIPTAARAMAAEGRLSILTTIAALADIWGPVYAEMVEQETSAGQPMRVKKYNVSKGCIRRVPDNTVSQNLGAVRCHWFSWKEEQRRRLSRLLRLSSAAGDELNMSLDDKLLIGTDMSVNGDCTFSLRDYEANFSDIIRPAGPKPPTWKFDGVAASVQFAATRFFTAQIEGQVKRIPGTTIKEDTWQRWKTDPERRNPYILNCYFGVEISSCTGNARRLLLKRILLMDPVRKLLERQFPGWTSTPWGRDFVKALYADSSDAVFDFWTTHEQDRSNAGRLVSTVLDVLNDTGCTGSSLQAAVLHDNQEDIVKIETKNNDWASLLKDSDLTATYAIVNEVCLEYRLPDHTTSICMNDQRYSVLQTQLGVISRRGLGSRVKISPQGLRFKKVDTDAEALEQPYLLTPESTVSSVVHCSQLQDHAKELLNPRAHDFRCRRKVILRASRPSFGGMQHARSRTSLDPPDHNAISALNMTDNNLTAEPGALSQLEIETIIRDNVESQDREESRRDFC